MNRVVTNSAEETLQWAESYAKTLVKGDTVLLQGEMGAGKTVVARGVARGLQIDAEITSPTYAYVNAYEDYFYHFDCYRIQSERQAIELGLADYFDLNGICLVEWSENIQGLLPPDCKRVWIKKLSEEQREITF